MLQEVRMLVVVLVFFVLCWLPTITWTILNQTLIGEPIRGLRVGITTETDENLTIGMLFLSYFSSCVNPLLYAVLSR